MTLAEGLPNATAAVEGFWSVEVVGRTRDLPRKRYVCHARGDLHANSLARSIMGETRDALGFDLARLPTPPQQARALGLGEFMPASTPQEG